MSGELKIRVGGSLEEDGQAFIQAWKRAQAGDFTPERSYAFESWEAMISVLTGERVRLLRHLRQHPERSVNALAQALKRQYRRVHDDVRALEKVGLLDRSQGQVRATVDKISAEVF